MTVILKVRPIRKLIVSCLISILCITGCWSSREVEDLAIITLMGLDRITEGEVEKWQVSSRIFKASGEQKGEVTKGTEEILVKGTGRTIQEADLEYLKRLSRIPFFGHMNSFVIGERAAKEGLEQILSIHMTHVHDRPHTFILVSEGEALDILGAEPDMGSVISKEITAIVRDKAERFGTAMGVTSAQFIECLISEDRDACLPKIMVIKPENDEKSVKKTIAVEGFGVFRGSKLVGWLNKDEAKGFIFLCGDKIQGASIIVPIQDEEIRLTYTVNISESKIKTRMDEGKLFFKVTVRMKGTLTETGGIELTTESLKEKEELISQTIEKMCISTITKSKELDAEFIGFMQKLHQVNPKAWQEVKENWREAFNEAEVEVDVQAKVLNTGRITKKIELKD